VIVRIAALIVLAMCAAGTARAEMSGAALQTAWLQANRAAIASIHDAKKRVAAQAEFDATVRRMQAPSTVPVQSSAELRATAARELAAPGRYDLTERQVRPREKTLWERFWDGARDLYDKFWNAVFGRIHLGPQGSLAFGDAMIALFATIVLVVGVRLLIGLQIERSARNRGKFEAIEVSRSAHALYLQACDLAKNARFAMAVRVLFLAAVVALDLRGVLRDDASATVGDLRRTLRERDGRMVPPFDEVADAFIAAAYAEREILSDEWQRALDGYRALIRSDAVT
jgi:hypothetical protein